jgi:carbamoylphosphate synthase large subunit
MNKYLICESAELLKNFPKLIKEENYKTVVISREKSALTKNKYIDEYIAIKEEAGKDFADQLLANKELISQLDGWIIWGNDEIIRKVATSKLPLKEKLRILPAKKKIGLQILGSKVGLAKISNKIKLNTPKTIVAKNNNELKKQILNFKSPFIVKADKFGGGEFVRKVSTAKEKRNVNIPEDWFPVVIQEFVIGNLISVEAFFKNGKIIAWQYTSFGDTLGEFGASYARIFENPQERGFKSDLMHLAKECGLEGMFNCTFILKNGKYFLIEADARPNAWHFLYSYFKIPILEIMTEKQQIPSTSLEANLNNARVKIVDLDRSIPYAVSQRSYKVIFRSIVGFKRSTQWIAGSKVKTLKILIFVLILLLVTWLPKGLSTRIKNFRLIKATHHRIFER